MRRTIDNKVKIILVFLFLILLDLFVVLASTLSPYSKIVPSIDSSVFIYMGQRLRDGAVPYRDAFDHKGPLLYAIEWLGLTIGNGSLVGIWIMELISAFVFLYFMYRSVRLFTKSNVIALASVFFGTELLINSFEGGNFSEEYALPFIAYSLWVFLKYIYTDKVRLYQVMIAGACCGSVLLLRVNMISVWIAWALVVLFMVISDKQKSVINKITWIIKLILSFIAGVIAVITPFVIWYASKGALKTMIDTYLGVNMMYVGGNPYSISSVASVVRTYSHMMVLTTQVMLIYVIAVICWSYHNNDKKKMMIIWGNILYMIITLYLISISGRSYSHYLIIFTSCEIIAMCFLLDNFFGNVLSNVSKSYKLIVLAAIAVLFYLGPARSQASLIRSNMVSREDDDKLISEIEDITDPGDNIFVMDNRVSFMVKTQTHTDFRYEFSPDFIDITDDTIKYLKEERPKVIVKLTYYENGTKALKDNVDKCVNEMYRAGIYSVKKTEYSTLYILN